MTRLESLADFLCNSLEHCQTQHDAILEITREGISPEQAKKLLDWWWSVDPKKRLSMGQDELLAMIQDCIE